MAIPQYKLIANFRNMIGEKYGVHKVYSDKFNFKFVYDFTDEDIEEISEIGREHFGKLLYSIKVTRFDTVCDRLSFGIGKGSNYSCLEFNPKKYEMDQRWE